MEFSDLKSRIAKGENLHTEFKQAAVHADDLAAGIVAFANTDGGDILFGVTDKRAVAGVEDPDKICRYVDKVALHNCDPPITIVQEILRRGAKSVVIVRIPKGDQRPYRTNRGVYYVRTSSCRRQASREELLRLFQATESLFYDETPLIRAGAEAIDRNAFQWFLQKSSQGSLEIDPERLLHSWRLISGDHPTIAGIVLFGRDPQSILPFAQINAARIPGTEIANDPSDRKDLRGQLFNVIEDAMRFLYLHLPIPHRIRGMEPEPKPELPEEALREAVVNAVAHRDYTVRGPIRLFIFDDRIEFHTPGRPPNTVDGEAMLAGAHVVRNPHIYARLSDAGLVTRAGSGIPRMARLVKQATGRELELRISDAETLLRIPRKIRAKRKPGRA